MDPYLKCTGEFIKGSRVEGTFIKCGRYGPKTVETILSGSHYFRSFNGLIILAEAIERLKFKSFWSSVDETLYEEGIEGFVSFQKSLSELNSKDSY